MHVCTRERVQLPLIFAPTKEFYLCANPGDTFTLTIEKTGHEKQVYAPKLFIDGQVLDLNMSLGSPRLQNASTELHVLRL